MIDVFYYIRSVLKTRLKKAGNKLTTRCSQLKMTAADGKQYATDCFAQDDIIQLVRVIPSKKTADFLDWFVYSDNTIDGQSKKKGYALLESGLLDGMKPGTVKSLQQIHAFLFGGLYDFAGKIRAKTISKGNTIFCLADHLHQYLQTIEAMPDTTFDEIVDKYIEMNMAHPFMEGKKIRELLRQALTNKIDDRETFMKGIDYSYYYEQEE